MAVDASSMHSSQNEQNSRLHAKAARIARMEPPDSRECVDFMKEAYRISKEFDMPVLFRTTTRVSHSKSLVSTGQQEEADVVPYEKNARKSVSVPANAYQNHLKVEKNFRRLAECGETCILNRMEL